MSSIPPGYVGLDASGRVLLRPDATTQLTSGGICTATCGGAVYCINFDSQGDQGIFFGTPAGELSENECSPYFVPDDPPDYGCVPTQPLPNDGSTYLDAPADNYPNCWYASSNLLQQAEVDFAGGSDFAGDTGSCIYSVSGTVYTYFTGDTGAYDPVGDVVTCPAAQSYTLGFDLGVVTVGSQQYWAVACTSSYAGGIDQNISGENPLAGQIWYLPFENNSPVGTYWPSGTNGMPGNFQATRLAVSVSEGSCSGPAGNTLVHLADGGPGACVQATDVPGGNPAGPSDDDLPSSISYTIPAGSDTGQGDGSTVSGTIVTGGYSPFYGGDGGYSGSLAATDSLGRACTLSMEVTWNGEGNYWNLLLAIIYGSAATTLWFGANTTMSLTPLCAYTLICGTIGPGGENPDCAGAWCNIFQIGL